MRLPPDHAGRGRGLLLNLQGVAELAHDPVYPSAGDTFDADDAAGFQSRRAGTEVPDLLVAEVFRLQPPC
jgi:hypothetical protein